MATASWMDPSTRKARLLQKQYLEEMPHRIHRMSPEEVNKARWEGCEFIKRVGESLKMYRPALCCACVLFNRFYARNGFKDSKPASWRREDWNSFLPQEYRHLNWRFVAVGCLFLAGKIEDNPKKITDVVRQFHLNQGHDGIEYELTEPVWRQLKDTILSYERLLLQDIEFDMIVEAPVAFNQVAHCIKYIDFRCSVQTSLDRETRLLPDLQITDLSEHARTMLRLAAEFVNDSLFTTLWLEYDAPTIALGLVWLTCKYYSFGGSSGWWRKVEKEFTEINTRRDANGRVVHTMEAPGPEVLDDIGDQMISFYEQRRAPIAVFPPLPDEKTGLSLYDHANEPPRDDDQPPFKWRYAGFVDGEGENAETSWLSREECNVKCSCPVWKSMESMKIPVAERTCRCIQIFIGGAREVKRVGIEKAVTSAKVAKYLAKTRKELQTKP